MCHYVARRAEGFSYWLLSTRLHLPEGRTARSSQFVQARGGRPLATSFKMTNPNISASLNNEVAGRARSKIRKRILPFLFVLYIISYLDRANIAFAKISMTSDLHFSEAVFGFGAGIFFVGYLLLEIPGAIIVEKLSARRWFARILITWGVCATLVGFIRTPTEFYATRLLLGISEAGFFPGVIVYLNHWFSERDRARAMAGFTLAVPFSLALGAPISALILRLDWLGLAGWRWVFILEGVPAIICGIITIYYLTDHPHQAQWLSQEERNWIQSELDAEKAAKKAVGHVSIGQTLRQRNVLLLALSLCLANVGGYAFIFWLPTTIRMDSALSIPVATAIAALPFLAGLVSNPLNGSSSDRTGERKLHTAIPLMLGSVFFTLSTFAGQPKFLVVSWLILTGAAVYAFPPPFWVLPTLTLGETAAAASIGLINSIGNLGGFLGPMIVGYLLSRNLPYSTGMNILASAYLGSGLLLLALRITRPSSPNHNTGGPP
jgi:MFS transporter, ACS family, tartrate transporter